MIIHILLTLLLFTTVLTLSPPTLKWKFGGACFNSWCHTGWYSTPAIGHINGQNIIVAGQYQVTAMTADKTELWKVDSPGGSQRVWADIVVSDMGGDGLKVVVAWAGGWIGVFDLETGVPYGAWVMGEEKAKRFCNDVGDDGPDCGGSGANEFRSLAVGDLNGDGKNEICVGRAISSDVNLWCIDYETAELLTGWPNAQSEEDGYTWGIFQNNIGITNMDGDSQLEVVAPSDVHYTCVYKYNGDPVSVRDGWWPYDSPDGNSLKWGHVGQHALSRHETDTCPNCCDRDWDTDPRRMNTADALVVFADIDFDGNDEVIFSGRQYQYCGGGSERSVENGLLIVNKDRTRWNTTEYDWSDMPTALTHPEMGPTLGSYTLVESNIISVTPVDLDNDGILELLLNSYDGKMHCFWADKTQKHSWPYVVGEAGEERGISQPVVADLDNDGFAEVIFTTWTNKNGIPNGCSPANCEWGDLIVLDFRGNLISKTPLPETKSCNFSMTDCSDVWNGGLSSPTLYDIDDDGDLDIVFVTAGSGVVAYTFPGTSEARVYWYTSKGNFNRDGNAPPTVRRGESEWGTQPEDTGPQAETESEIDNVHILTVHLLLALAIFL